MKFSDEQQAFIDASFNRRFAEIQTKHRAEIDAFKRQVQELQAGKGQANKGEDLGDFKAQKAALLERVVNVTVLAAAAEAGAVNGEQVAVLVGPSIRSDDAGDLYVITPTGETRYNADGKPTTVRDFVKEFLASNPHMVRTPFSGAGSQGARGGAGYNAEMPRAAFDRLGSAAKMDYTLSGGRVQD